MTEQQEMVAICEKSGVYHRTYAPVREPKGSKRRPRCANVWFYSLVPLASVQNSHRLCKRCKRIRKESHK